MTERVCACGCGRSLDGAVANQKWHKSCAGKRQAEQKRGYVRAGSAERKAALKSKRSACGVIARDGSPPRPAKPMSCQTCCDLPWRRDRPSCKDCRRYYAPEPVERVNGTIRSSARLALQDL